MVAAGYAVVLAFAAAEFYARYLLEQDDPAAVSAASGMWAGGDLLLELFVAVLLMIPTFFLVRIGSKFETPYTIYSKTLLIIGFSAPLCLALLAVGSQVLPENLVAFCFERLMWSPFILAIIGMSRLMARFDRAKRFMSYALLLEVATLGGSVAAILYA
jgi:hypothetical protein